VAAYYERFRAVLSPANAQQVQLLLRVTAALLGRLSRAAGGGGGGGAAGVAAAPARPQPAEAGGGACATRVNALLFELGLDNINMFQLLRWIKDSKFGFKVAGD
jgi:hypothetical protein